MLKSVTSTSHGIVTFGGQKIIGAILSWTTTSTIQVLLLFD